MTNFDPLAFVTVDGAVVAIDYHGILAAMTGTEAEEWDEIDGPSSGVGVDYHFGHAGGAPAYALHDQFVISISVADANGDGGPTLEFEIPEGHTGRAAAGTDNLS